MKAIHGIAGALLLGAIVAAPAQADGLALAQKNNCLACHAVDQKLVGPSYKEIAAKYKGDATAPDKLAAKVKAGGAGSFGQIPMPPNPQVSDADMKEIIAWILAL